MYFGKTFRGLIFGEKSTFLQYDNVKFLFIVTNCMYFVINKVYTSTT